MTPQEQALRQRLETQDFHVSFLVEAGAGAGKSHTICQRILHQLQGGQAPQEIVAITFTEKATLELKEKLDAQALAFDRAHGTNFAEQTHQIHISTIHSFCETILRLFPLESGCGLEFEILDAAAQDSLAGECFRRQARQDPGGLFAAFENFGGSRYTLEDTFRTVAGDRSASPSFAPAGDPGLQARQRELDLLVSTAHQLFFAALGPCAADFPLLSDRFAQSVSSAVPTPEQLRELKMALIDAWGARGFRFERFFFTADQQVQSMLELYSACKAYESLLSDPSGQNIEQLIRTIETLSPNPPVLENGTLDAAAIRGSLPPVFSAVEACCAQLSLPTAAGIVPMERIAHLHRTVGYDLAMAAVVPAVQAFQQENLESARCSFDDLLLRARDLVRDVPAARQVLHRRFRVFYVDEFQDTDPVQAELLFLLTHQGQDGQRDWKLCRPTPGSLFLVGDPKQAIYRFRGADLDIYKQVKALFSQPSAPLGEVVELKTNFRSNAQICTFVDKVFAPKKTAGKEKGRILTPAEQQANGSNQKVGATLDNGLYQAGYTSMEAEQGSAGRAMVFRYPNYSETPKQEDAVKLARFIQNAVSGGYTLRDRSGVPAPVQYGDFLILTRTKKAAQRYLDALAALGIPVFFSGQRMLADIPQVQRIAAFLRYLLDPDNEVLLIELLVRCYGLSSLGALRPLKRAAQCPLPLLVTWPERRDALAGQVSESLLDALADISQKLADSRALPPNAFLDRLAEEMTGLAAPWDPDDLLSRQLSYTATRQYLQLIRQCPWPDFPRLAQFALSRAQDSLDQELPISPAANRVRVMNLHKSKGLEGKIVILALDGPGAVSVQKAHTPSPSGPLGHYAISRKTSMGSHSLLYAAENWDSLSAPEKSHSKAEAVRLLYVAATRAEQLLLIASGAPAGVKASAKSNCWASLANAAEELPGDNDSDWTDFFRPLGENALTAPPAAPAVPAAPPTFSDCCQQRQALILAQSAVQRQHISPSALDKSHRRPVSSDPEDQPEPEHMPTVESADPAPSSRLPMGADWGTMVHRVMELYVGQGAADPAQGLPLIQQAVAEVMPALPSSAQQRMLLFGEEPPVDYAQAAAYLTRHIQEATRFWFDSSSPLRRLTSAGRCHCELPFHLLLTDPAEGVYSFIRQRLKCQPDFDGSISVSGILDLAVLCEEGWYIVDYKTDHVRPGESREAYRSRLSQEYQAQLCAYVQILARLTGLPVAGTQLCAIPLGGEMIPISME